MTTVSSLPPTVSGQTDVTPVLGTWRNCNSRTSGISRIEPTQRDGQLRVHVWGTDPATGTSHDWGEATVETVYTDGPGSGRVNAYAATFDLGHARSLVQVNISYGVTVVVAFTTFTDGSGRQNYMSREFFIRE